MFPFCLVSGAYATGTYGNARRFTAVATRHPGGCGELTIVPDATHPPLLALTGVSRRYGERLALSPIDVSVAAGECVAVMGANGSGKSTLLRIAAGRDTPSTGQVVYSGRGLIQDDVVVRTEIAVVGDMVSAYPDLTVREHLQLVAVAHGAGQESDELVDRALLECRLADHVGALPGSLSSGQRQALHLAAVLVRPRRLMVLDEPEQRLDPAARRWLAGLLVTQKQAGATVLMATHHAELATAAADHVIVLRDGEVIGRGEPGSALAAVQWAVQ
jgi:ABC-2 type transport system ATP-binding protein